MGSPIIVTIIGGGSVWTPYLLEQLSYISMVEDFEIRLHGTTVSHLQQVKSFVQCFVGDGLNISVIADIQEALSAANIILNQARIGGWKARLDDEVLPVQFGGVGDESLGIGGLRAAIRSWPFIVQTSHLILKEAPNAWLLNLSNPSDLISRAWRECGCKKVLSLCDYPHKLFQEWAELAGSSKVVAHFDFLGMTHIGWLMPRSNIRLDSLFERRPQLSSWYKKWKALPTPWRIHLSESESLIEQQQKNPGHRASYLNMLVQNLRNAIQQRNVDRYRLLINKRLPKWYSEVIVPAINGLFGATPTRLVVGLPNDGRLAHVDPNVNIEGWALIDNQGIHPEPLPENIHCRKDIANFSKSRTLAFAAIMKPTLNNVLSYMRSDAFSSDIVSRPDWQKLLGFSNNELPLLD